jgi:dihydroflavonol-4-reductase
MRVLVTGASGFIGSVVARRLLADGSAVRCLVRRTSDTARVPTEAVDLAYGDVRDAKAVDRAVSGCDAVVHLACPSAWTAIRSPEMEAAVVAGTRHVLEACVRRGARRVVYVSSVMAIGASRRPQVLDEGSVSPEPLSRFVYVRAKRAAEGLCRRAAAHGLGAVIVNPGEVYGPGDTGLVTAGNLLDFARSSPVLACHGGVTVAHVDDVAEGIVSALERGRPGERYVLGGENVTIRGLAALTLELLGREGRVITAPNALVRAAAWLGRTLRLPLPFEPEVIPYATLYWFMDNAKARRELGVSFRPARETLASTLAWLARAGHVSAPAAPASREVRA